MPKGIRNLYLLLYPTSGIFDGIYTNKRLAEQTLKKYPGLRMIVFGNSVFGKKYTTETDLKDVK